MDTQKLLRATCPDCNVMRGERHTDRCQTVECLVTGLPRFGCRPDVADEGAAPHDCGDPAWDGRWPGHDECDEFGWFVAWDGDGWVRCTPDRPGSGPDLTRLRDQAVWVPEQRTWRQRRAVLYVRSAAGGRSTLEAQAEALRDWCADQGYLVVAEHGLSGHAEMAWRAAVDDVAERADVVAVYDVSRLGRQPKQVFGRVRAVEAAGRKVVGPQLRLDGSGFVAGTVAAPAS